MHTNERLHECNSHLFLTFRCSYISNFLKGHSNHELRKFVVFDFIKFHQENNQNIYCIFIDASNQQLSKPTYQY